jgi:hypothetical protein
MNLLGEPCLNHEFVSLMKHALKNQPINARYVDIDMINRHVYWICEKSDGQRCYIFVRSSVDVYIADRKFNMFKLRDDLCGVFKSIPEMHLPIVLDGELCLPRTFIPFDVILCKSTYNTHIRYSQRLGIIQQIIQRHVQKSDLFMFQYKHFYQRKDVDKLQKHTHVNDGYVLTPDDPRLPVYKIKYDHTLDFKVKAPYVADGVNKLYLCGETKESDIHVSEVRLAKGVVDELCMEYKEFAIIECTYKSNMKWDFIQVRGDKVYPNSVTVAFMTMESIIQQESGIVTVEKFLALLKS